MGSSMRRFLKSLGRGASAPKKTTLEAENEDFNAQEEPQLEGLYHLNKSISTVDEAGRERFDVDIVAIHGLNGTPFGTWTQTIMNKETRKRVSTLWLRDLLPEDVPGARIYTYGYPSQVCFSKSRATTEDFAQKLLWELKAERRGGHERRPIIFITHSLGGLVCKQALIRANQNDDFRDILASTIGILFFGTPHRGASGTPEFATFVGNVFDSLITASGSRFFTGGINTDLVKGLKADAPDLSRITEAFSHLIKPPMSIITVYETEEQAPLGRLVRYDLHLFPTSPHS